MVLLYGIPGDGPFELIADALEELNEPYVILDQRRFRELDFVFQITNDGYEGELSIGHLSYPLTAFKGIYNRGLDFAALPEAGSLAKEPSVYQHYEQLFSFINIWIEIAGCKVVNKASAMSSNASKPYQLALIQPYFKVPDTLITNNILDVEAFEKVYPAIIYKSASSVRSIVKTTGVQNNPALQAIRYCATLFQQRLQGTNYRVHVVDKEVFATRADTDTVDYRYSHRDGKETNLLAVKLKAEISEKCIALAKKLQLPFAGIDLFLTTAGEWYCFEVNPSPGFSYFEAATDQPISYAVACYLAKG